MLKSTLCPCKSNKKYTICCGPYHKGKIHPPNAETLMRSRYSAYVVNNTRYVYRSWDENTRPPLNVLREDNSQLFVNLEIINANKGGVYDETGTVEFVASYKLIDDDSKIYQHHENSYFIKSKKRWLYVNELGKVNINE